MNNILNLLSNMTTLFSNNNKKLKFNKYKLDCIYGDNIHATTDIVKLKNVYHVKNGKCIEFLDMSTDKVTLVPIEYILNIEGLSINGSKLSKIQTVKTYQWNMIGSYFITIKEGSYYLFVQDNYSYIDASKFDIADDSFMSTEEIIQKIIPTYPKNKLHNFDYVIVIPEEEVNKIDGYSQLHKDIDILSVDNISNLWMDNYLKYMRIDGKKRELQEILDDAGIEYNINF